LESFNFPDNVSERCFFLTTLSQSLPKRGKRFFDNGGINDNVGGLAGSPGKIFNQGGGKKDKGDKGDKGEEKKKDRPAHLIYFAVGKETDQPS
jgi:hypothetical protein